MTRHSPEQSSSVDAGRNRESSSTASTAAARSTRTRPHRSETRRQVLDAAFTVFGQRGIATTSLSEVAAQAGMTKGAVYSSFASKDDLILALMEEHAAQRIEASLATLDDGEASGEVFADVGAVLVQAMHVDATWHRLLAEYFAMAHHDPTRRAALRERRREVRNAVVRALELAARQLDFELPLPAEQMAVVLLALSNGLAVESDIDPDGVSDDLLGDVLTLIAGDAMAKIRKRTGAETLARSSSTAATR